jgi:hypothetical protein
VVRRLAPLSTLLQFSLNNLAHLLRHLSVLRIDRRHTVEQLLYNSNLGKLAHVSAFINAHRRMK